MIADTIEPVEIPFAELDLGPWDRPFFFIENTITERLRRVDIQL